ncbi:GAF domain-containing protein [Microlunatus elymi]|uniref:GAF domain-containing protein n=1 Tax=Microlunatus elymi TaxID=2596828 RepID=A0A516PW05_9ACTN|nr:GAF domain-containing protein [Microlunatus elymi]QDP95340.1 GAF domain-containing protein [Microlunatus elymi]
MVTRAMAICLASLRRNHQANQDGLSSLASSATAAVLGVTGVGASVASVVLGAAERVPTLTWGDDPVSRRLADLQFTTGEGPAIDAIEAGAAVFAPDLAELSQVRWPAFTAEAIALDVRAVFALPLQLGAIKVGVLVLHRDKPGPLSTPALGDAVALADAATSILLSAAALAPEMDDDLLDQQQMVVFQATGMISVQLGIDLTEALIRLRAHAYGNNRMTSEVAEDVVARRLRFDEGQR